MKGMSKTIKEIPIPGGESKKKYLYIDDAPGLFGLVQIGVLEIHDWGVSLDHIDEPDRLVFDLDPDEGLDLATLKAAAVEVRDFLADLGFKSFLKSTGGKGLHVVAPLTPKLGWDEVKPFAKAIADALVSARPDRYTANPLKKTREGKIFVDYLRNQRGGSAIVNYSTRAKEGAPVACPLRWDELKGLKVAAPYTVKTLPARLKALEARSVGGIFLDPPVDHRKGAQGARVSARIPFATPDDRGGSDAMAMRRDSSRMRMFTWSVIAGALIAFGSGRAVAGRDRRGCRRARRRVVATPIAPPNPVLGADDKIASRL